MIFFQSLHHGKISLNLSVAIFAICDCFTTEWSGCNAINNSLSSIAEAENWKFPLKRWENFQFLFLPFFSHKTHLTWDGKLITAKVRFRLDGGGVCECRLGKSALEEKDSFAQAHEVIPMPVEKCYVKTAVKDFLKASSDRYITWHQKSSLNHPEFEYKKTRSRNFLDLNNLCKFLFALLFI